MTLDYFPFYYDRWMKSTMRATCTMAEQGIYLNLLFRCCAEGFIPTDLREIAGVAGCSYRELRKSWPRISKAFEERGSKLVNAVSLEVRAGVLNKRESAQKSALARWKNDANAMRTQCERICETDANAMRLTCEVDAKPMLSENRKQKREKRESTKTSGVMPPLSLAADPDAEFMRVAKLLCETLPAGGDVHRVVTAMRAEFARSATYEGDPLRFAKSIEAAGLAWRAAYDANRELKSQQAQYWLADGTYAQKPPQPRQRVDPGPVYLGDREADAD